MLLDPALRGAPEGTRNNMKLAIMQPYFFPYIGYFQLIRAVDRFVIYDNIKYTKKGWINRNRILHHGKEALISLPLKKGSDFLDVRERELAAGFNRDKLCRQFMDAYHKAPYFGQAFPVIEAVLRYDDCNLFRFLQNAIVSVCTYLGINTPIEVSSSFPIDHTLKGQDRVIALCRSAGASGYINPIGGVELYSKEDFLNEGIVLNFIKPGPFEYKQFENAFIPWLSIADVMMFNTADEIARYLASGYELI